MAEQSEIQWLDGQAKYDRIVEKICPKRHIRQDQWQSKWNEMYLNDWSEHCYDYISDYECMFSHPIFPYPEEWSWDSMKRYKQQGTDIRITDLAHFTTPESAEAIIESEGFFGYSKKINEDLQGDDIKARFSWWSPVFTEEKKRDVREFFGKTLRSFIDPVRDNLHTLEAQFATSDAFRPNPDRYGSSFFKYDIDELCYYYGNHFKGEVRFKILGTLGYKQEVMYAVLVCSQANAAGMFGAYPEVPLDVRDEGVCSDVLTTSIPPSNLMIWRPQATGTEITRLCRYWQPYPLYRRWDNVAFAFHIPDEWAENDKLMVIPDLRHHLHELAEGLAQ